MTSSAQKHTEFVWRRRRRSAPVSVGSRLCLNWVAATRRTEIHRPVAVWLRVWQLQMVNRRCFHGQFHVGIPDVPRSRRLRRPKHGRVTIGVSRGVKCHPVVVLTSVEGTTRDNLSCLSNNKWRPRTSLANDTPLRHLLAAGPVRAGSRLVCTRRPLLSYSAAMRYNLFKDVITYHGDRWYIINLNISILLFIAISTKKSLRRNLGRHYVCYLWWNLLASVEWFVRQTDRPWQ